MENKTTRRKPGGEVLALKFARSVLCKLNLKDWKVEIDKIDDSGTCFLPMKLITIPKWVCNKDNIQFWQTKEYILHEIAHINSYSDNNHGKLFYREYVRLLTRFMANL